MIDIHTHVLPKVDDGSRDINQSISLLMEEISVGVTDVVLTPHLRSKYRADKSALDKKFEEIKQIISENNLSLNVHLGREVYISKDYKSKIKEYSAVMPNSKYVLIEFAFTFEAEIVETVYELIRDGYKPIVAHIERYDYATLDDAIEIKNMGGLIQINAGSLFLPFWSRARRTAMKLLKSRLVDFVASDIHFGRKNMLKRAFKKIEARLGKDYAQEIFIDNAKEVIKKG